MGIRTDRTKEKRRECSRIATRNFDQKCVSFVVVILANETGSEVLTWDQLFTFEIADHNFCAVST
jgi:hypothetical protein